MIWYVNYISLKLYKENGSMPTVEPKMPFGGGLPETDVECPVSHLGDQTWK